MSDPQIEVSGFCKRYGAKDAVVDLDVRAMAGEIYGLVGPNGAGKTTTIRSILGLIRPTSGRVLVSGTDPYRDRNVRTTTGAMLEDSTVYAGLTALDNLVYFGKLQLVPDPAARARSLLERFGLDDRANQRASTFSKGMRRKLAMARALMPDPPVLVFDEPTSGIDPHFQQDFQELVSESAEEGRTVFLSSHNLREVQELCDRLTFMQEGRGVMCGTVEEITRGFEGRKYRVWLDGTCELPRSRRRVLIPGLGLLRPGRASEPGVLLTSSPQSIVQVIGRLADASIEAQRVEPLHVDLDDVFELAEGRV